MGNTTEKIVLTENEKQAQKIIVQQVEQAINMLVAHMNKFCVDNNVGSVPFVYIKMSADIFLKSFKEGADKA